MSLLLLLSDPVRMSPRVSPMVSRMTNTIIPVMIYFQLAIFCGLKKVCLVLKMNDGAIVGIIIAVVLLLVAIGYGWWKSRGTFGGSGHSKSGVIPSYNSSWPGFESIYNGKSRSRSRSGKSSTDL